MDASSDADTDRAGLGARAGLVLALLVLALHVPDLGGPFRDGQRGNCGAMFALFARNAGALGWVETGGVPVVNPGVSFSTTRAVIAPFASSISDHLPNTR